jgi:hypothetical protein
VKSLHLKDAKLKEAKLKEIQSVARIALRDRPTIDTVGFALRFCLCFNVVIPTEASFADEGSAVPQLQASRYPNISFTFSKKLEDRSTGLFSTFDNAPNCSNNRRCSREVLAGITTRMLM